MVRLVQSMTGDHPGRPCLVVSNAPGAGGLAKAQDLGVPVAVVDHKGFGGRAGFEAALDSTLRAAGAEVLALAGFMRILSPGFLAGWTGRVVNIHPSLLPKYPGLHTHARALAAGDARAGCTVHLVTADLDAGPILGQVTVPVLRGDIEAELAARVLAAEHRLYPLTLRAWLAGDRLPVLLDV